MGDNITAGGNGANGSVTVQGKDGQPSVQLLALDNECVIGAGQNGRSGRLTMYDAHGQGTVNLTTTDAHLKLGASGVNGIVSLYGKDGRLTLFESDGKVTVNLTTSDAHLQLGGSGVNGTLSVVASDGQPVAELISRDNESVIGLGRKDRPARMTLYNNKGEPSLELNGGSGDITLFNADCAEEFDLAADYPAPEPGAVVVLDEHRCIHETSIAYDRRVAGVVSGAGPYRPALVLDRRQTGSQRYPVALMGKVFCRVDASHAPVDIADLLTTSPTPGYAMKAEDPLRAFGSVIGKAMACLRDGCGLIPVLVALR